MKQRNGVGQAKLLLRFINVDALYVSCRVDLFGSPCHIVLKLSNFHSYLFID